MKNKRAVRESRNKSKQLERRNRIRALLIQLGIWDELTDPRLRDYLLDAYYPPIQLSLAAEVPVNARIKAMMRKLKGAMQVATFDCPVLGTNYSVLDYFTYVLPVVHRVRTVQRDNEKPALRQKLDRIDSMLNLDVVENAMDAMYRCNLRKVLADYGRMDDYLYYMNLKVDYTPHGRLRQRLVVDRVQPERRYVSKNDESRRVYRCGHTELDGVEWIDWSSSALGLENEDRTYPVFVQRHALRTYLDRVGQVFRGDQFEGRLQDALAVSLVDPKIHQRADGTFLAEFHLRKYKVGYFVARKLDGLILIETFLFLTMDGTPEGIELKRQWKLERAGKEFTGLDNLATFLLTDVASDPDLVKLLSRCGCGHLFEMSKDLNVRELAPGYAADIRKYLRMPPDYSRDAGP